MYYESVLLIINTNYFPSWFSNWHPLNSKVNLRDSSPKTVVIIYSPVTSNVWFSFLKNKDRYFEESFSCLKQRWTPLTFIEGTKTWHEGELMMAEFSFLLNYPLKKNWGSRWLIRHCSVPSHKYDYSDVTWRQHLNLAGSQQEHTGIDVSSVSRE